MIFTGDMYKRATTIKSVHASTGKPITVTFPLASTTRFNPSGSSYRVLFTLGSRNT